MYPIVRACERQNLACFILRTGQDYSYGMCRVFFWVRVAGARCRLDVGSWMDGEQAGGAVMGVEGVLVEGAG